ncbi:MAG TPA: pectate lyase [Hanamia sp.]|nr:pectate lyase [Hanamia sp.]
MERRWKLISSGFKVKSMRPGNLFQRPLVICCLLIFISSPASLFAQQDNYHIKDVSGFQDSRHHWMDITDHEQVILPSKNQSRYEPSDVRQIADNILLYQQPNGGWPKNYDMLAILTDEQKVILAQHKDSLHTTFDNGTTYTQVEYLAKAYTLLGDKKYEEAALHGLDFILNAQYENGGWPQFYPDKSGYRKYITFNDDAMIGVMEVLQHIVQNEPYYSFVNNKLRSEASIAYQKGIDCILKCQIVENGKATVWCQQHDNITLKPVGARTFELSSKVSEESVEIVRLLMHVKNPASEIINAVKNAVAWFQKVEIKDVWVKIIPAKDVVYKFHEANYDRIVIHDSVASPIWTRFYELGTDRPMFANRDGKKVYQFSDVLRERRTGYAWYGYWPQKLISFEYPAWLKKIGQ